MDDYKTYLAQQLLTEDKLVTYRLLSRALKVHVNTAKEMLYDFHKSQNDKKPGTLHATYMVYGVTKSTGQQQDGDVEMTDSQPSEDGHGPFSDTAPTQTLSLVKEEQLQEVLAQYDQVRSIHIYSLAPHPLKDLQLLVDTSRQVMELSSSDASAVSSSRTYGWISNPNVRRRERRGAPPKPVASVSAPKPKVEDKAPAKEAPKPDSASASAKEDSKASQPETKKVVAPVPAPSTAKKSSAAPSTKRQNSSSGIGQMFAKAASKAKKPAAATATATASKTSSAAASPAAEESSMAMSDDGEDDSEPIAEAVKQEDGVARQSRKDRQADLRRMMEESDEEEEEQEAKADSPAEEPMEEDPPAPEPEPKAEEPAEVVSSTSNGRRRGRRRVMRKKQTMDEQGYLVTKQEVGWESFSEDEAPAAPPPSKTKPAAATQPAAAKAKKPAAKGAQGNIMSFFSKK